jgi:urease accessory protein
MATDDHPAAEPARSAADGRERADGAVPNPVAAFETYEAEPLPQAGAGSTGKAGELRLRFAADGDGRTRLVTDFATVPFHLPGGLTHDEQLPELATVYVQSPTGGFAQGDRHEIAVTVETDAQAHVTTQSAEKVLRMERNCARADVQLTVEDGGYLEYLPEPTILYPDARYRRETTLTVGEGATALVGDIVVPGRLARGEAFDFERLYTRLTVEGPDGLLAQDTTDLAPGARNPQRPGVVGDHRVLGTLYVVGAPTLSDQLHDRVSAVEGVRGGATTLPNDAGVLVRALGARTDAVAGALDAAWEETRAAELGAGRPARRKD